MKTMKIAASWILLALSESLSQNLAEASDHTHGQVTLQFSLTARQQVTDTNYHATLRTVRVGTLDVLRMLGATLHTNLSGCTLTLRNDWNWGITNQVIVTLKEDGADLDVSQYFSISWGNEVWQGSVHPFWSPEGKGYGIITLGFNDGQSNSFVVQGLVMEVSKSKESSNHNWDPFGGGFPTIYEWNSWQMTGAGEGTLNGEFAAFQGTIVGRGQWR